MTDAIFDRVSWPRRTERLTLRPATTDDLPAVFAIRTQREVAEWMPDRPESYDDWLLRQGRIGSISRMLVMEQGPDSTDGPASTVIGDLYLYVHDGWAQAEVAERADQSQAEIGWCLSPDFQGQGFVTEAMTELVRLCFEDLGLRRLTAEAFADNTASLRVMERLGMVCEARHRADSLHRDRGWRDGVVYALLADDWRAAQKA